MFFIMIKLPDAGSFFFTLLRKKFCNRLVCDEKIIMARGGILLDKERLVFLHHCEGITWHQIKKIVDKDPDLKTVFKMDIPSMVASFDLSSPVAERLRHHVQHKSNESIKRSLKHNGILAVTIFDKEYPPLLKTIYDPPWVLYGKGDWNTLSYKKMISIVGTRNPSKHGIESLRKVVLPLINDSWTVVSGLARGIDTYAHRLCTENKGRTAAVLGSGLQNIYPKENIRLAEDISRNGIIISEFPPFVPPKRWHFPIRNRIISGLTDATLVAEARKKSGSLITADQALEQGRDVYAIPGSILEDCAEGTNLLIQNGAKLVMSAADIQNEWQVNFHADFETV
jgi:DNA processing protein